MLSLPSLNQSPPCWQHGYKGSALPTEGSCGFCTLLGVHHHPELDSIGSERSRALDALSAGCLLSLSPAPLLFTIYTPAEASALAFSTQSYAMQF